MKGNRFSDVVRSSESLLPGDERLRKNDTQNIDQSSLVKKMAKYKLKCGFFYILILYIVYCS